MGTRKKRIFIGSSSEAEPHVEAIERLILDAGFEPLSWKITFSPGETLLETIEKLDKEIDGAILLITPDLSCQRGSKTFAAPTANVIFEYGQLAAHLTRRRVILFLFDKAELPSDISAMGHTSIRGGTFQHPVNLPDDAANALQSWIKDLPLLVSKLPPTVQLHGYSGRWTVRTSFKRWRGVPVHDNQVYFEGCAQLYIATDGRSGTGQVHGTLTVDLSSYKAKVVVRDNVLNAAVHADGGLWMQLEVTMRHVVNQEGDYPDPSFEVQDGRFELLLRPDEGSEKTLKGDHRKHKGACESWQDATETYQHVGF